MNGWWNLLPRNNYFLISASFVQTANQSDLREVTAA